MEGSDKKLNLDAVRAKLEGKRGREYFRSLEEVSDTPEFQKWVEDEFPNRSSMMDVDRRDFLKFMGASMALAGLAGCRSLRLPTEQAVTYITAPEDVVPGKPLYFSSVLAHRGSALGIQVETHEGRPTKIEGNPDHPTSLGSADSFAYASMLDLYDPDRLEMPQKKGGDTSWDIALRELREVVDNQKSNGGSKIAILTETVTSRTLKQQLMAFKAAFPNVTVVQYSAVSPDTVLEGANLAFGQRLYPSYDLSTADVVVTFDADFVQSMPENVRMTREFSSRRNPEGDMNRLYAIESSPTLTGAMADHRFVVKPSEVDATVRAVAESMGITGAPAASSKPNDKAVKAISQELASGKKVIFLAGASANGAVHALVAAMNQKVNASVSYHAPLLDQGKSQSQALGDLVKQLKAGQFSLLLILGGNPIFDAPSDYKLGEVFKNLMDNPAAPVIVHHATHLNETGDAGTYALPASHFLESWGDEVAQSGAAAIQQPMIAPLHESKSHIELLDNLLGHSNNALDLVKKAYPTDKNTFLAWVEKGVAGEAAVAVNPSLQAGFTAGLAAPKDTSGTEIAFRPDPTLFDGRYANNAWLQETPKPLTTLTWDNPALISPKKAKELGIQDGDHVKISANGLSVEIPAMINIGHPDEAITLYFGNGRSVVGTVGEKAGVNVYTMRTTPAMWTAEGATIEKVSGHTELAATQTHHSMEGRDILKVTTLADFKAHGLEQVEGDKIAAERLSMYPDKIMDTAEDQWAMTIDLSLCTGCHACVTACQSENNIPVVGKTHVLKGREMHWIRIDRYYKVAGGGNSHNDPRMVEWDNQPEDIMDSSRIQTVHQPFACTHCENAPCEPVCPVAATVHSAEGLNQMVYNRCVGTRYCSNNCPYKVRRFNFLNWTDNQPNFSKKNLTMTAIGGNTTEPKHQGRQLLRLIANPDVTVRSRGVMEKCTYCVQRINTARISAKKDNRKIADGEIITACQQACPAGAIVFGNGADANSKVTKSRMGKRNFDVLPELNTRNRTTYLAKVRNTNTEIEA